MPAPLVLHRVVATAQAFRLGRRGPEPFALEAEPEGLAEKVAEFRRKRWNFHPEDMQVVAAKQVRHGGANQPALVGEDAVKKEKMTRRVHAGTDILN